MAVKLLSTKRYRDARGWVAETYNEDALARVGVYDRFRQDNYSRSEKVGVLRGLHFQRPPHAQAKLVRCVRGRILDVVVDLRRNSPTYGKWVATELSAENFKQLYVPVGFAHGFLVLEEQTEVEYKASACYAPGSESGVIWSDPDLAIAWPLNGTKPILSTKDQALPRLIELETPFSYDGEPMSLIEV